MNAVELKEELQDIDCRLQKLSEQRLVLMQKLRETELDEQQQRVARWDLKKNDCLLMFSKKPSSFYLAKTVKITDVHDSYYCTITGEYMTALGETEFRCHDDKPIGHAGLQELEENFTIYVVDEVQYVLLIQKLCELTLDYDNVQTYADAFKDVAERIIS